MVARPKGKYKKDYFNRQNSRTITAYRLARSFMFSTRRDIHRLVALAVGMIVGMIVVTVGLTVCVNIAFCTTTARS